MRYLGNIKKPNFSGKTCLLRVDFNVADAKDSLKLEASLPTMKFLLKKGAKVIILSHRGRPRVRDEKLSLRGFQPFLEKEIKEKIIFLKDIPKKLPAGKIFLLENLRFWPEEENNDLNFAKKLATLGDFYVNDAFAVCHRKNASVTQLPKLLPSYAGLLLEKEIKTLSSVMKSSKKPLVLIFGGAKLKDKIGAIKNLLPEANELLLGSSILQKVNIQYFTLLRRNKKTVMPVDWLGEKNLAFDIGPLTAEHYRQIIKKAGTIIWNGPLGKFEDRRFAGGSMTVAKEIVKSLAFSIIGGGETTALFLSAIPNYKLLISKNRLFLSTGGGAMLEFLSGKKLPGIIALK